MNDLTVKKELTPLQERFLECLFDPDVNGNIRKAMTKAGYSENTTQKEVVEPLKNHILEITESFLALNAPKAAIGIVEVIDTPFALGNANKLKAAESLLDRIGITKKDNNAVKLPQGAIIYLPPKEKTTISIETETVKTIEGTVKQ